MSHTREQTEALEPASERTSVGRSGDFGQLRSRKRELLAEQEDRWAAGSPVSPELIVAHWPKDAAADDDVASVLFQDLMHRRARGENPSLDEYSERFPDQQRSLAALVSREDLFRSIAGESSPPRCTLSFPEVGDELYGFRFRAELGRGAFARVFLAEQIELAGRAVAVKVSAIEGTEPQTLAQMQHTHIVPIYSVQDDQRSGLRAVCMPYFGGASLSRVLQELWAKTTLPTQGRELVEALERLPNLASEIPKKTNSGNDATPLLTPLPSPALERLRRESYFGAVAWLGARIAEGLQHSHQRGVLHRDIKPSNILLGADGQPMLLDFNLSRDSTTDPTQALLGGTVAYMSPEHLRAMSRRTPGLSDRVDRRSDIYSLGMVLYEMLTGKKPFEHSASYSVLPLQLEAMAVERSKGPLSLRADRPDAPWSLESILRKCLAPHADDRYQEAEHLADDLRRFLDDQPLRYAPELSRLERLAKWRRRHPRLTYAAAVTSIAGILLAVAGSALVTVQHHLAGTQETLGVVQAKERKRAFDTGVVQALCLVNTTVGPQNHFLQGTKVCEETLALYGALSGETWREPADWLRFPPSDRRVLAEDTRELLMLLAASRVRLAPADPAALRGALELLDRAEAVGRPLPESSAGSNPSRALWLDRARYLDALGESAEAKSARQSAEEIPAASAREHYLLATSLARAGSPRDYGRAITELDKALALDPRHYWSWLQRGICHTELGEFVLAAGDFGRCTGLWPDFAWGHFNLGYVQAQSGKTAEAIASYTRALECDPALTAARVNLGLACLELKRYPEALVELDQALSKDNDDAALQAGRGMALEALKRYPEADAAFRSAFTRAADLPTPARLRMRWAYGFAVSARLPAEARQAFKEVIREDPKNAQAHYGLAMTAMAKGDAAEAIRHFDVALETSPQFVEARLYRAIELARTGALQRAGEDINWCLTSDPHSGASLYAAACVASLASKQLSDPALAQQSLDLLEKAFAQGVGQDKVDDDPDLAGVRANPEIWRKAIRARDNDPSRRPRTDFDLNVSLNHERAR
jgi:eukaryotic-like serine/threonine-protein kinase